MTKRVSIESLDEGFLLESYDPDDYEARHKRRVAPTAKTAIEAATKLLGEGVDFKEKLLPSIALTKE